MSPHLLTTEQIERARAIQAEIETHEKAIHALKAELHAIVPPRSSEEIARAAGDRIDHFDPTP